MTESLRDRAERELREDFHVCVAPTKDGGYEEQRLDPTGTFRVGGRPVTKTAYTIWSEAVRGRVALLEKYLREVEA